MKKLILLIIISSVFLFASVGKITGIKGEVYIDRNNKQIVAKRGSLLERKDKIVTKQKSKALILFNDKTSITIGKNSILEVEKFVLDTKIASNSKASFKFKKGLFRIITGKIGKLNRDKFKIKTTTASIGIRGTVVVGDQQNVAFTQGYGIVTSHGVTVPIKAGELTVTMPNKAPTIPVPIPKTFMKKIEKETSTSDMIKAKVVVKKESKKDTKEAKKEKKDHKKTLVKTKKEQKAIVKKTDNAKKDTQVSSSIKDKTTTKEVKTVDVNQEDSIVQDKSIENGEATVIENRSFVESQAESNIEMNSFDSASDSLANIEPEVVDIPTDIQNITDTISIVNQTVDDTKDVVNTIVQDEQVNNIVEDVVDNIVEDKPEEPEVQTPVDDPVSDDPVSEEPVVSTVIYDPQNDIPLLNQDIQAITNKIMNDSSDTYMEFGYVAKDSNDISTVSSLYLSGMITPSEIIDDYIKNNVTASYSGGISGFINDIPTTDGFVSLYVDFGKQNLTGYVGIYNDTQQWITNINSGTVTSSGFSSTDMASDIQSSVSDITGELNGKFYGPTGNNIGGDFKFTSPSAGSAYGVFGGGK